MKLGGLRGRLCDTSTDRSHESIVWGTSTTMRLMVPTTRVSATGVDGQVLVRAIVLKL